MVLRTLTLLHGRHTPHLQNWFYRHNLKVRTHEGKAPHCPSCQALAATIYLLSVCTSRLFMNLTTLGTSYKWSHTAFIFLRLAYFLKYDVFKVHLCRSMYQNFLSF